MPFVWKKFFWCFANKRFKKVVYADVTEKNATSKLTKKICGQMIAERPGFEPGIRF